MKKYSILSLFFLISLPTIFGTTPLVGKNDMFTQSKDWLKAQPYQKTSQAFLLSYGIRYINGHDGAVRYKKYMQFYTGKKFESRLDRDTLIDLAIFPAVDYVVGYAMIPVKGLVYVRGTTQKVSPHAMNFMLNNLQLAASAGITKFIHLGAEKKFEIKSQDIKNFGKACATQVTCDAVDEAVIQPLVQMAVGDDSTWVGLGVHSLANMALVYYFVGK